MKTQSVAQHTPGPWKVWPNDGVNIVSQSTHSVARALNTQDARLIASAPELLEALKALRDYIEETTGSIDPAGFSRENVEKILRFVKQDLGEFGHAGKAIAKAEGRA